MAEFGAPAAPGVPNTQPPDPTAGAAAETYDAGVSSQASTDVATLMKADAEDESLRRYKETLMGAAAHGDLGDASDPRRVVIEEFRIIFEDPSVSDIVADLSTEAGLAMLRKDGVKVKEGSNFKFSIKFRINHSIVDGLMYTYSLTRMGFGDIDTVVLGSYAPQSQPHCFEYPRRAWEQAPKGMMFRGKYTARCKFEDKMGGVHIDYSYPLSIVKG